MCTQLYLNYYNQTDMSRSIRYFGQNGNHTRQRNHLSIILVPEEMFEETSAVDLKSQQRGKYVGVFQGTYVDDVES
jgi:hypothetical protein